MSDQPIALNVSLHPVSNNKDQRELVAMVAGSLVSFRITKMDRLRREDEALRSENYMLATRQDAREDISIALGLIADIAEGSTSADNLPHIARIARTALGDEVEPDPNDSRREKVRWRGPNQETARGAAPPLSPNECGDD